MKLSKGKILRDWLCDGGDTLRAKFLMAQASNFLVDLQGLPAHKTASKWTFHYLIPSRENKSTVIWQDFLKPLTTFSTYEEFFALMQCVESPGKLPQGCRYYIFKENIQPLWEDEKNKYGTQIMVDFPMEKRNSGHAKSPNNIIANKWEDLVIRMMIDGTDFSKNANGIEFNNRGKSLKIAVWYNKDKSAEDIKKASEFLESQVKELKVKYVFKEEKILPESENPRENKDLKPEEKPNPEEKPKEEKK